MTGFITGILVVGGVLVGVVVGLSLYAYRAMFHIRIRSSEYCKKWCLEEGEFTEAVFDMPWEGVEIFCSYSKSLIRGHYLDPRNISGSGEGSFGGGETSASFVPPGAALFVHGITWTWYGMIKYIQGFIKEGWIVLAIDLPAHGESPGGLQKYPSYGYHEKYVLHEVVQWFRNRLSTDPPLPLIVVGESMGAATALQYAPLAAPQGSSPEQWKVQAIIADCSYSSAAEELDARLKASHVPLPLVPLVHGGVNLLLSILRGYRLEDASPLEAVLHSSLPIMFVHGAEDTYVPTWMSEKMAARRREAVSAPTGLLIVPDAVHAKSAAVHPERWFPTVFGFLQEQGIGTPHRKKL